VDTEKPRPLRPQMNGREPMPAKRGRNNWHVGVGEVMNGSCIFCARMPVAGDSERRAAAPHAVRLFSTCGATTAHRIASVTRFI
jgi:hypothetical protein